MIILGIDYGDARTGLAISGKSELLASPLEVIHARSEDDVYAHILQVIEERSVEMLVLGLPKNMDGSHGARAQKSEAFAKRLETGTNLSVVLWDERLSTVTAHRYLNDTNTRGKKRKESVDAVAATIILESFLAYRRNREN